MNPILESDARNVWHPYTGVPHQGPRTQFTKAEGAYVYDCEGNKYFDSTSSWWCVLHGHSHPRLVKALTEQAEQLDQILFAPHTHEVGVKLAERLLEKLGSPFQRIFYSDDGSTAVEAAMKMALQYWHNRGESSRRNFLSLVEGYHGDTLGAVSVGYIHEFHHFFDQAIRQSFRAMQPYCYRCPKKLNYPSCKLACLEGVEHLLESRGHEIAALVIEPIVMGAAGMVIYPTEYLEQLMRLCREKGVLVIFDEVFTGFGRTGTFFAMDQLSEKPDMIALSKGLTSGMLPLGVTAATEEIYSAFTGGESRKFFHGHTFSANPLGCAVALESLKLFDENKTLERNQQLIKVLSDQRERFLDLPNVGDLRHSGMIWAIELVKSKDTKDEPEPANGPGWAIAEAMWREGVWNRPIHNVLYVVPPYCSKEEDLHQFFSVLYKELLHGKHF